MTPIQTIQQIFDYLPSTVTGSGVVFKTSRAGQTCDKARLEIKRLALPLKAQLISGSEFKVEEV